MKYILAINNNCTEEEKQSLLNGDTETYKNLLRELKASIHKPENFCVIFNEYENERSTYTITIISQEIRNKLCAFAYPPVEPIPVDEITEEKEPEETEDFPEDWEYRKLLDDLICNLSETEDEITDFINSTDLESDQYSNLEDIKEKVSDTLESIHEIQNNLIEENEK